MKRLALVAVLLPAIAGAGTLDLVAANAAPSWDSGNPISSNVLDGMYIRLYGAGQGSPKALIDAVKWAPKVTFHRVSNSTGMNCYDITYFIDTNANAKYDPPTEEETAHSPEYCAKYTPAAPVETLKLAPPALSGKV